MARNSFNEVYTVLGSSIWSSELLVVYFKFVQGKNSAGSADLIFVRNIKTEDFRGLFVLLVNLNRGDDWINFSICAKKLFTFEDFTGLFKAQRKAHDVDKVFLNNSGTRREIRDWRFSSCVWAFRNHRLYLFNWFLYVKREK